MPGFPFEMSFKSSLKLPVAILRHVFVYFSLEKINSFFFFFKTEKQEFAYYIMAKVNSVSQLCVSGKKIRGYD